MANKSIIDENNQNVRTSNNELTLDSNIQVLSLSNRAKNALKNKNVNSIKQLLDLDEEKLADISNIGEKTKNEIVQCQKNILSNTSLASQQHNYSKNEEMISRMSLKDDVCVAPLSNRAINALKQNGVSTIKNFLELTEDQILKIHSIGEKTKNEIIKLQSMLNSDEKYTIDDSEVTYLNKDCIYSFYYGKYINNSLSTLSISSIIKSKLKDKGINYVSDIFGKTKKDLIKTYHLDYRTADIIIEKMENYNFEELPTPDQKQFSYAERFIIDNAFVFSISDYEIKKICNNLPALNNKNTTYSEFCDSIYKIPEIEEIILNSIIEIIRQHQDNTISINHLKSLLPISFTSIQAFDNYITTLLDKSIINISNTKISIRNKRITELINTIIDDRQKEILSRKLKGETLSSIGNYYNISRERVRQICNNAINHINTPYELVFFDFFEKYNFSGEDFCFIFQEPIETFNYLSIISSKKKEEKLDINYILDDNTLLPEQRNKAYEIIYRDYIKIDDEYVYKSRQELLKFSVKKFCKEPTSISTFETHYNNLINTYIDQEVSSFMFDSLHNLSARLSDANYTINCPHYIVRFYPIYEYDWKKFYDSIDFLQFNNLEISTALLFDTYKDLMTQYSIKNFSELHNLIKKTAEYAPQNIVLSRTPHLKIGNTNSFIQIENLMLKYAPIEKNELAKKYEEEYGVNKSSVIVNILPLINQYYSDGYYHVNDFSMPDEEIELLKGLLTKDFYLVSELKTIVTEQHPNINTDLLTAYNLKKLGYNLFSSYIVKDSYPTARDFFLKVIYQKRIFNENNIDLDLRNLTTFRSTLYSLLESHELFHIGDGMYISYNVLTSVGIRKDKILEMINEISSVLNEGQFFSSSSLINIHSMDEIVDKTGFDHNSVFFDSLIYHYRDNFCSIQISKNYHIFRNNTVPFVLTDVIESFLKEKKYMEKDEIQKKLRRTFNLDISRDIISKALNSSDFYCCNDYVYLNKATFLEELKWI